MNPTKERKIYSKRWREKHPNYHKEWHAKNRKPDNRANKRGKISYNKSAKRNEKLLVVYVIEAAEFIKVGIAEDIKTRLVVFKTHCPLPVRLAYSSKPMLRPKARQIEVECHRYLISCHHHGEWFKATAKSAIEFISTKTEPAAEITPEPTQLRLVS